MKHCLLVLALLAGPDGGVQGQAERQAVLRGTAWARGYLAALAERCGSAGQATVAQVQDALDRRASTHAIQEAARLTEEFRSGAAAGRGFFAANGARECVCLRAEDVHALRDIAAGREPAFGP